MKEPLLFTTLLDNLPYPICWIDIDSIYRFCNQRYETMAGLPSKNIIGRPLREIMPKEIAGKLLSASREASKRQKEVCYERIAKQDKINFQTFKVRTLPFLDSSDRIIGTIVIEEDITQQKVSELKQRQEISKLTRSRDNAKSYLENIIRHFPANVYWKDKNGVILGDNLSHAKMAGFNDPSEVIGKTDYEFVWREQADQIRKNDLEVMSTGKTQEFEEVGTLADGMKNIFLTIKTPLYDASKDIVGVIGISVNITEAKHQQEEQFKAMASLSGMLAHELRTPLTSLKVTVDSFRDCLSELLDGYGVYVKEHQVKSSIRSDTLNGLKKALDNMGRSINMR